MIRWIFRIFVVLIVMACAVAAYGWWYIQRPLLRNHAPVNITIPKGFTLKQAARAIAESGVDIYPEALYWLARAQGRADFIVAGSYIIPVGITASGIIDKLVDGDVERIEVRFMEGVRFADIRKQIENHPDIENNTGDLNEQQLLHRIGATESHPEGLFFPNTYIFDHNVKSSDVFIFMYRAMKKRLERVWQQRSPDSPLKTPYEALILASIIEKETGQSDERALVASVFSNRLRKGMRLQTDPTVIYGSGPDFAGRLRRRHLQQDHAYNTYLRYGLPPTPIALPSMPSLLAAVQPAQSNYLYFVAKGDGTSHFSSSLKEHNQAVHRYIRRKKK